MKFLDFFSGIGGFRKGMEMAGHERVGHCEIDRFAEASYRSMHTITEKQREKLLDMPLEERQKEILKEEYLNGEWYADDITRVDPGDVPNADCYCFGFPCQSFSIAGHRRGFDDIRGTLFFEVMRIAKERKPDVLFAENVAGLLNHEGGVTFGIIINTLQELGYCVEWQVCNSKYYVPQNRERVFIVGHLGRGSRPKVFPIGSYSGETSELQGHTVVNTITTRAGGADTVGTFIATDRQTDKALKGERIPQGMIMGYKCEPKETDVASTLQSRDYKGVSNYGVTVVVEHE